MYNIVIGFLGPYFPGDFLYNYIAVNKLYGSINIMSSRVARERTLPLFIFIM